MARKKALKNAQKKVPKKARKSPKERPFWRITVLCHGDETHVADIPTTQITRENLIGLMEMVFAKGALTYEEMVSTKLRRNVRASTDHFRLVERYASTPDERVTLTMSDGSNVVHAIALRPGDKLAEHEWPPIPSEWNMSVPKARKE